MAWCESNGVEYVFGLARNGRLEASIARERNPVAAAKRSAAALAKAQTRRLADGAPALSFRGLLTHLATIVRNTMRPKDAKPGMGTFTLTTEANSKQRQALDLAAAIAA
jgi:hypothetical protein